MLLVTFLVLAVLALYPMTIYPFLVVGLAKLRPRRWEEGPYAGRVTHIVTVFNEGRRIRGKLENSIALAAPPGGVDILVVSDGSTDGTHDIVREYEGRGVRWMGLTRRGKEAAQIDAVQSASSEVLVFSDASTTIDKEGLVRILQPFADPAVAAVSGTDRVATADGSTGEDLYVRYEMAVRRAEALAGSLVGLSGCFFAVRREVAERLLLDVPSDMGAALISIGLRRRAVVKDDATCAYALAGGTEHEFARKRRTALRGIRGLRLYAPLVSRGRLVELWQVLSHKVLRFASPIFLIGAVVVATAAAVSGQDWALVVAGLVALAAAIIAVAEVVPSARRSRLMRAAHFFALANAAVLAASIDFAIGRRQATWSPTARPEAGR